jgi:hypothetical protein
MTFKLSSGFSSDATGPLSGFVATGSFFTSFSTNGRFFTGTSASIDNFFYSDSLVAIQSAISGATNAPVSIRYDYPSGLCILSSSVSAQWQFTTGSQKVLGFLSTYVSGTKVITGSFKPWFIWDSTYEERANDSEIYEDKPIFTERIADSGRTYSVGNDKTSNYRDWSFNLEPKENLFSDKATTIDPFTYDLFLKNLRKGPYQFIVYDSTQVQSLAYEGRDGTYEMRADAMNFKPKQVFPDYFDYWNIDLKTRLLSRPNMNPANVIGSNPTTSSLDSSISGMVLWLNANAGGQFTSTGSVTKIVRVYDQSPLRVTSSLNMGSLIPYMASTSSWGNKAVYAYSQSLEVAYTDCLYGTSTSPVSFSGVSVVSITEVTYDDASGSLTSYSPFIYLADASNAAYFSLGTTANQNTYIQWRTSDSVSTLGNMTSSYCQLGKYVSIGTLDFTTYTSSLYVNGTAIDTGTVLPNGAPEFSSPNFIWTLNNGSLATYAAPAQNIAEIQVYNRVLTPTEINTILTYANNTYGITSSLLTVL